MKKIYVYILIGFILGSGAAYAQQAAQQPNANVAPAAPAQQQAQQQQIDPAAFAAAKELIAITRSDDMIKQFLPVLVKNFSGLLTRDNPQKKELIDKMMDQVLIPNFMSHLPEFQEQVAMIYATNLSANDMQQLVAFYKTPAGQRFLQAMPVMTQQTMALGQVWGRKIGQEAAQQLIEQLKKNNMQVPKEMGL